ncbi:2-octaprenyl-3-methyl-6-methoxy-1,4-benzoquinol hydroxylase [Breoghania corrubedonensis]|uniref:2-octaprenyl-3-methyl-6-methoxy-1,4-benzoquinol hydroxylase n=1 Tax=Breoghania corrubedonensis TaxID=665038 RepID=A0A2T5V8N9_9HYPH|nr:UbiH/UbiF family hydroxylase [Breoghania corrubedonensis]PTW60125.1 2-octaprenyl-3-methyl-6-methoxy-1,4-benzoquinol hydroxylase [Breoghania corrubedonensis]
MNQATADRTEIAVVGSGPSGMIAALLLSRRGFSTVLVGPRAKADPRTTALLDASVAILGDLGIWEDIAPLAAPLRQMRLIDDTGRLVRAPETLFDSAEIDLDAFGYNVLNNDLNSVLEKALAASSVTRIEALADAIRPGDDGVEIDIEGRATPLRVQLLVASDGRSSRARDAAGIAVQRWSYPQSALVANLSHQRPHDDTSTEFHTPHGPFTLVPLKGNRSSLVWVGEPKEIVAMQALDDAAFAREVERHAKSILGPMTLESGRQVFPLSGMKAKTVAANRIALVGETAHVFPPIGAQGLNLSLRDVADLGDACERARSNGQDIGGGAALSAYAAARRGDIDTRIFGVDTLNRTLLADFLPIQMVRGLGLYLAGRVGPLRRLLMREGVAPSFRGRARSA